MATFAYLRISTISQDIQKNKYDILEFANRNKLGEVRFVEDVASGRQNWKKRSLCSLLSKMQPQDTLIVSEFSRLGRSMLECMEVLSFALVRELKVYAIKGNWQLDDSLQSKIVAMAFSIASEIERDLISQRTTEALKARKAKGYPLGRPKGSGSSKLDTHREKIEKLLANGSTQKSIAQRFSTTEANLHNWLKKHQLDRRSRMAIDE